eukprot:3286909-Alexandrium_andersonii.AAC.1
MPPSRICWTHASALSPVFVRMDVFVAGSAPAGYACVMCAFYLALKWPLQRNTYSSRCPAKGDSSRAHKWADLCAHV